MTSAAAFTDHGSRITDHYRLESAANVRSDGRHAADFERIAVTQHAVSVEQVEGAHRRQWEFDPRLAHVQVESRGRQWGKRVHIYLLAPGIKLELGRHLLAARRSQLGTS